LSPQSTRVRFGIRVPGEIGASPTMGFAYTALMEKVEVEGKQEKLRLRNNRDPLGMTMGNSEGEKI